MTKRLLAVALLMTSVFGGLVTLRVHQLNARLVQREAELNNARLHLATATEKLAFLDASKTRVQVTAYALT